jgi:diguanylate cyclase (GGDEF)-like protein/PAS domain S-box-containing protein
VPHLQLPEDDPEPGLDSIVGLARRLFDVAHAAVSLKGAGRSWWQTANAPSDAIASWADSFLEHAPAAGPFVVEDALQDPSLRHNPLVAGPPYIRFFAAAPLPGKAGRLGWLSLMGDRPRAFSEREAELLSLLAEEARDRLQLTRLSARLRASAGESRPGGEVLREESDRRARNETILRQVSRLARIGGWTIDLDEGAIAWSDEIYRILGIEPDIPLDLDVAMALVFEHHQKRLMDLLQRTAETGQPFETEFALQGGDEKVRWLRILGEKVPGVPTRQLFGTVQDVTARHESEEELRRLATTDSLTGLPNRHVFGQTVEEAFSGDVSDKVALLLLDLDEFKSVNDTLGHDAGDRLLVVLARRIRSCLRPSDSLARLGGDEFGVLVRGDVSTKEIVTLARLLLQATTAPISYGSQALRVGASIGIAVAGRDAGDARTLWKRADIALYGAKRTGGDDYRFFSEELGREVEHRASLLQRVHAGLEAGEFTVAYQPIVHLRTRAIIGFETLVRWQDPERGLLAAGTFMEALEDPVLGRRLSDVSLEIAVAQFGRWVAEGESVGRVGVNVHVGQLRDDLFVDRLLAMLAAAKLGPQAVTIEVTEGVLLSRGGDAVVRRIQALHELGTRIALDDFGTGYASLTHLRQLPVDILKIDSSFVRTIVTDGANRTIVRSVIEMAHGLGMRAVAEGVEGPEVDAMLALMGCDLGQGYHYGRPMPAEAVPGFILDFTSLPVHGTEPRSSAG